MCKELAGRYWAGGDLSASGSWSLLVAEVP